MQLFSGKISITLDIDWKEPKTDSALDIAAATRALRFKLGWFANPIYIDGDYPIVMRKFVAKKSQDQGLNVSRLPAFTAEEKQEIKGALIFFASLHVMELISLDKIK